MKRVIVSGGFEELSSRNVRLLHEAALLGSVRVFLFTDAAIQKRRGTPPKFPLNERVYFLQALRTVETVRVVSGMDEIDALLSESADVPADWIDVDGSPQAREIAARRGIAFRQFSDAALADFPPPPAPTPADPAARKVIVTGCYDWFHSGHVRFFEEAASFGDLYVVVGHDDNIRLLKGSGHPLFPAIERQFVVGSVRFVKQSLISTGAGWMDAEPEIARIKPDMYIVNEDGDRPEKRAFCDLHGLEYRVLKRAPKQGLPARQSTALRGF